MRVKREPGQMNLKQSHGNNAFAPCACGNEKPPAFRQEKPMKNFESLHLSNPESIKAVLRSRHHGMALATYTKTTYCLGVAGVVVSPRHDSSSTASSSVMWSRFMAVFLLMSFLLLPAACSRDASKSETCELARKKTRRQGC